MRLQLKKLFSSLEEKVADQTKRLENKVKQLQKFQELTVDSEIYAEKMRVENQTLRTKLKALQKK